MPLYELRKDHSGATKIYGPRPEDPGNDMRDVEHPYILGQVEASTWVEAKEKFNLPLTEIQRKLASGQISHFELFGRHWSAADIMEHGYQLGETYAKKK